ncbi:hypothetical protein JOQ06_004165 [Pogonophryne albipinna]|uniref:Uncharacterized protein n=1 Tax=Pogonophryne albipinna TaxID=1090488 RepID=A0AAD6F271_9TELE|nr:hypothetical protein JOQ06_004165 [Pogonophryne albipinna]
MNEHILFCKKLTGRTTGQDVFNVIDNFFSQHKLDWKSCSHVCTDGAAAMTGRVNGLMAHIKKTKHRNRLNLENNLVTAVATISSRLTKLMREKQAQVSH